MNGAIPFTLLIVICFIIYRLSKRKFNYWKKRNIPYLEPVPFLGNYGAYILQKKYMGQVAQDICQKLPNAPYIGAFYGTEPALIVQDPEMIKTVMTKDFYYFNSREVSKYSHKEVRTQNLFFTYGDRWKVLRKNLSPTFSTSKMKNMFYLLEKCAYALEDMLQREIKNENEVLVKPLMARFTTDSVGTCAFGINPASMSKDYKNNPFTDVGHLMFLKTFYRGFKIAARVAWPAIFYGLRMKCFPSKADEFFDKLIKQVFAARQYKTTVRNDFIDLMMNWKEGKYITGDSMQNAKDGDSKKVRLEVDDDMLVAQVMVLFNGGFETSSSTLQFLLYEFAKHLELQQRAIDEIDEYMLRHNNKLKYDVITELPFIEACFSEVLRLYPALGVLHREAIENYTLPCGAVIEEGTRIQIPVYHLHLNPEYFPEPEVFRPERFYGDEKHNIKPGTYLAFGEGPRFCIGMRFAKVEMFAGIVTILKRYRVELAKDTPRKLDFAPTTVVTSPTNLFKLKFVEREGWQKRQFCS